MKRITVLLALFSLSGVLWVGPGFSQTLDSASRAIFLPYVSNQTTVTVRPWPDATAGIHVFNDQLASSLSDAQWQFAATHYAGTQKMTRADADRLRAINPDFLILHYRLGHALGYRGIENGCDPTADWLLVVEGDDWVQEWPASVREGWFYHWPESGGPRVLNCDWGWYLAELNSPAWRSYWQGEILRQVQANADDGVFMDSLSVPNFLGYDRYTPHLPEVDSAFESAWATRIADWLAWLQTQPLGNYYLVPNVGSWITTRDTTDYSAADGVMIEGFAIEADASPYVLEDWQLQMNRILGLVAQGKAILGQSYAAGAQERGFALGCYLLIKGDRTYFNIDLGLEPEWWPEYDIPIGTPSESAGTDIANLYDAAHQVYRRTFDNGTVWVNPTSPWDGTGQTVTVDLGATRYLAQPSGGGDVPESGIPTGSLTYAPVTHITLGPYSAAVLLNTQP